MKTIFNAVLFSFLISIASGSYAEDYYYEGQLDREGDVVLDLLFVRPLSLIGSAVGVTMQIIGLPFSVTGDNFGETGEILVEAPLNYTFNRPLGHFEDVAN